MIFVTSQTRLYYPVPERVCQ